jgi:ATP-dependent DNA helicase RecQ
MPAKLIQTNEGFNLYHLLEIRYFLDVLNFRDDAFIINDALWKTAKSKLWHEFRSSSKIGISIKIIKEFEAANPRKKYRSDFEVFVRESKLEDFSDEPNDSIFVSTIHKAKGREFDTVFLMLDNFDLKNDEKKRMLYVAMTRAKQNLIIHLNASFMDDIFAQKMDRIYNNEKQFPPNQLVMHLSHKDIWLDYFISRQHQISQLKSGDELIVCENRCLDKKRGPVLTFSKSFSDKLRTLGQAGYTPDRAVVNYIVYWQKEDSEQEIRIILPELYFKKLGTDLIEKDPAKKITGGTGHNPKKSNAPVEPVI